MPINNRNAVVGAIAESLFILLLSSKLVRYILVEERLFTLQYSSETVPVLQKKDVTVVFGTRHQQEKQRQTSLASGDWVCTADDKRYLG